jgi:DNA ligase N terminus
MSSKKRSAPSTPTSAKSKKLKASGTTLDAFFKSPRSLGSKIEDTSGPGTVSGGSRDQPFVVEDEDGPIRLATPVATNNSSVLHQTNLAPGSMTPSRTRNTTPAFAFGSPSKFPSSGDETPPEYPDLGADPLLFSTGSCPWPSSKPAPYSFLAHVLHQLSQTKSRILLLNILTNALRFFIAHDTASITPSLYITSNSLAPSYVPTELGLGPSVLSKALQSVSGLKSSALRTVNHPFLAYIKVKLTDISCTTL